MVHLLTASFLSWYRSCEGLKQEYEVCWRQGFDLVLPACALPVPTLHDSRVHTYVQCKHLDLGPAPGAEQQKSLEQTKQKGPVSLTPPPQVALFWICLLQNYFPWEVGGLHMAWGMA